MEGTSQNLQVELYLSEIQSSSSNFQTLIIPDDLSFEHILPRLPVKSLIRFKSVCKDWYNLICSSQFAKSHLRFSSSSPVFLLKKFLRIVVTSPKFHLLSYDKNLRLVQLDCQLTEFKDKDVLDVVGCCNGLICFHSYGKSLIVEFSLWNPATREFRMISTNFRERLVKYGFGYVSALHDYKIFGVFVSYADKSTRVRVFSLRLGEWKQIGSDDIGLISSPNDLIVSGVNVGNSLYWTANKMGGLLGIICFNLVDDELREIPVPVPLDDCYFYHLIEMKAYKEYLSMHYHRCDTPLFDVWIMKKQNGCIFWEKLFSLQFSRYSNVSILAFSSTGRSLVQQMGRLKLIDPLLEDLEHAQGIDYVEYPKTDRAHHYFVSLISPFELTM